MTSALIGMGSNIKPEENLIRAAHALRRAFVEVQFSPVYQSKAIGMQGADFLNACCLIQSEMDCKELEQWCKQHENLCHRDATLGSWRPRTIDLDILMFDEQVVDDELYRFAHAYIPATSLVDIKFAAIDEALLSQVPLIL
ncbi:MAG: 2-amino-4-hydroxy-6-hydroxymethyldihydropteridine diphosphokinase [Mariprofundaceae bacterium]|nr:2-amino-4-hydroxy-6-hydroxymethyldihydropteridine diphosphokinase [Mariprofundaceae bacterium]